MLYFWGAQKSVTGKFILSWSSPTACGITEELLPVIGNFCPAKTLCFWHSLLLFLGFSVVQRSSNHSAGLGTAQTWGIKAATYNARQDSGWLYSEDWKKQWDNIVYQLPYCCQVGFFKAPPWKENFALSGLDDVVVVLVWTGWNSLNHLLPVICGDKWTKEK